MIDNMTLTVVVLEAFKHSPPGMDEDYRKEGYIDSLGFVSFVLRLERTFRITLTDEEVSAPAFRTLQGVVMTIERKVTP